MTYQPIRTDLAGVVVLEVTGVDSNRAPMVRIPGEDEPRPARVVWMKDVPDWASCIGLRAVVALPDGEEKPIIVGLLDPPPNESDEPMPRELHIESQEELIIQCGKSKIAMRADGRIEIRGGHLISRSSGPNKIKGGSVQLN
jgi:hypothetical protein